MRRKGEGTISRRKDGRYDVAISSGNGQRQRATVATEADAVKKLGELRQTHGQGLPFVDGKTTLADYLTKQWLPAMRPPRTRPRTWRTYETYIRCQLVPRIGRVKLTKLLPAHVETAMAAAMQDGVSPRGAQAMRTILGTALARAQRDGLVLRNVASLADPVKQTRPQVEPFSPAEATVLVRGIQGHRLGPLWLVILGTGIRHGEALALTWADVDLGAGMLHVRRSLERWEGQWRLVDLLKTARSQRSLPLPADVITALRAHQDRQAFEKTKAANEWHNDFNLVFTTEFGRPLSDSTSQHQFMKKLQELGLPKRRVYDLRHSAASFLIAGGADLRSVMEVLGHSQIALTANTYAHLFWERKKEMADIMDRLLTGMRAPAAGEPGASG